MQGDVYQCLMVSSVLRWKIPLMRYRISSATKEVYGMENKFQYPTALPPVNVYFPSYLLMYSYVVFYLAANSQSTAKVTEPFSYIPRNRPKRWMELFFNCFIGTEQTSLISVIGVSSFAFLPILFHFLMHYCLGETCAQMDHSLQLNNFSPNPCIECPQEGHRVHQ